MVLALVPRPSGGLLARPASACAGPRLPARRVAHRPTAAHAFALGIARLVPGPALAHSADANRAMLKGSIGRLLRPVAISSAISAPRPGPSWKPCPQKPNWW